MFNTVSLNVKPPSNDCYYVLIGQKERFIVRSMAVTWFSILMRQMQSFILLTKLMVSVIIFKEIKINAFCHIDTIRYLSLHDNKYLRYFPGHTKQ